MIFPRCIIFHLDVLFFFYIIVTKTMESKGFLTSKVWQNYRSAPEKRAKISLIKIRMEKCFGKWKTIAWHDRKSWFKILTSSKANSTLNYFQSIFFCCLLLAFLSLIMFRFFIFLFCFAKFVFADYYVWMEQFD